MSDQSSPNLCGPDFATRLLANVRGTTPIAIEQIDIVLRLLNAGPARVRNCLCIGAELDLLASAILTEHSGAAVVLVDSSDRELAAARKQLCNVGHETGVTFLPQPEPGRFLAAGPESFDAIFCGASWDLLGCTPRSVFERCHEALRPDGLFLMIRNVTSATRWTESVLDDYMIEAIFGEELRECAGGRRADIARRYFGRMEAANFAVAAPLEVQCDWLRESGFENVDCYLKIAELAIFGGQRVREPLPA